jgi:hypothetical protein
MAFPRRPSTFLRYVIPALLLTLAVYLLIGFNGGLTTRFGPLLVSTPWGRKSSSPEHPIDNLIQDAEKEFAAKLAKSTQTLPEAAAAYRKRRGRHPPPGFDKWHEFATEKKAIIVEDFWDRIYDDLEPFWALNPARIRKDAREFDMRIEIRDHKASADSDWFWTQIWLEMIKTIEHLLPDMDLALNPMDEPRMVVPWEEIDSRVEQAAKARTMADEKQVVSEFGKLPPPGEEPSTQEKSAEIVWEDESRLTVAVIFSI